jgi:hypothetical protein
MAQILIPARGPEDWKALLAEPERQWKRGYSALVSPVHGRVTGIGGPAAPDALGSPCVSGPPPPASRTR